MVLLSVYTAVLLQLFLLLFNTAHLSPNTASFSQVFISLPYDLHWTHSVHYDRVHAALANFETHPQILFNDPVTSSIVIEQIILGFQVGGKFFESRSRTIIQRLWSANPPLHFINDILHAAENYGIQEMYTLIASLNLNGHESISSSRYPRIMHAA
jgi:trimethylamine:corrinoid methyltransferase-like protein